MIFAPPCATCTRFHSEDRERDTCDAFPRGIPEQILQAEVDHTEPFPGDGGLLYERRAGAPKE